VEIAVLDFDRILQRLLRIFFALLYNSLAWSYDLVAFVVSMGMWNGWVLSVLPYLKGPRILELGYGPGHLQLAMRKNISQVTGIDNSFRMARIATRRVLASGTISSLVQGTANRIPFPSNWFDQVVATFPSEYFMEDESLGEIHRVLRPDGSLVVLPVAWITGKTLLARGLALLFRITKQAPEWNDTRYRDAFYVPLQKAGFKAVEMKKISSDSSEVLVIISEK
jgi:ubiquinone/menaquinone biosynthesis C-methylase UbiE